MSLEEEISQLSVKISEKLEMIQTEEATKNALILPFIRLVLGYDHTDPSEVVPEFIADVGKKKGEKVDYAIIIDEKPTILMECKSAHTDLDKEHAAQLRRYFTVTPAKFGVLTNGIIYRFYTDIEKTNLMDKKPFFELDLTNYSDNTLKELKRFTKASFNVNNILESASELKYKGEMKKIMAEQLENPSDDFVRFFAKQVYPGTLTKNAREQFTPITKSAIKQFINEKVEERLKDALKPKKGNIKGSERVKTPPQKPEPTDEELEGYYVVKSILSEMTDPERVYIRDRKSYCGVLLDDNQYKPLCRMHFNSKQKYIGLLDKQERKKSGARIEDKIPIEKPSDIYKLAERLKRTARTYDEK